MPHCLRSTIGGSMLAAAVFAWPLASLASPATWAAERAATGQSAGACDEQPLCQRVQYQQPYAPAPAQPYPQQPYGQPPQQPYGQPAYQQPYPQQQYQPQAGPGQFGSSPSVVGSWRWFHPAGSEVYFNPNGSAQHRAGGAVVDTGSWRQTPAGGVDITWSSGYVDQWQISSNGAVMTGHNSNGALPTVTRK